MDENKDGLQPADPQLPGRGSADSYPGRRLQKESTARRLWRDYGFAPITVAVMLVLLKVILQIAWVPSGSMEDTLPTRSLLLSWQMPYVFADPTPQRGDVVTFRSEELGKLLVKRVIGLPGDTVSIKTVMCILTVKAGGILPAPAGCHRRGQPGGVCGAGGMPFLFGRQPHQLTGRTPVG